MLKYLANCAFIGDLSLQDADVLMCWARRSSSALEFGSGGSTQLLAQSGAEIIYSVETEPFWVQCTQRNLNRLPQAQTVKFLPYQTTFDQEFDLVLVDGVDHLRLEWALAVWHYVRSGGVMLFHDTRRFDDFKNAAWLAQVYYEEVEQIDVNTRASDGKSSNMTVIHKKNPEPYVNWNYVEGKPLWAYGHQDGQEHSPWTYHG